MKRFLPVVIALFILGLFGLWVHDGNIRGTTAPPHHQSQPHKQPTKPPTKTVPPAFNKTLYSTTDPTSIWVIVNKKHPLQPLSYAPSDLTAVGNGQYMRAEAASALKTMLTAAQRAGFAVTPASGYRSYPTQVSVYNSEVKSYGQATADSESARPGYSEHQTGLAMDLASGGCSITDCFGTTPGGKWVTAHAYEYGFILRYPSGYTDVTGYRTETWHFRYVGTALSEEMHNEGVATLEQFFGVTCGTDY